MRETFHIGAAPAVQTAVTAIELEWIGGPLLPIHRDHVGVSGQEKSRAIGGPMLANSVALVRDLSSITRDPHRTWPDNPEQNGSTEDWKAGWWYRTKSVWRGGFRNRVHNYA